ncbi:hypothetical protein HDU97_007038 [Phlyctochytrium planicorne]|nr:hypothetical protein HDU97_007038 [Phlyctochytrium planicorne]
MDTNHNHVGKNFGSAFFSAAEAAVTAFELRRHLLQAQIKTFEKEYKSHRDNSTREKIQLLNAALNRHDLKVDKTHHHLDLRLPVASPKELSLLTFAIKEAGCRASSWESLFDREIAHLISLNEVYDTQRQPLTQPQNSFEHAVRVGVASRRAFQLRRETLEAQMATMARNSDFFVSHKYSDWEVRRKRVQVGVKLVESALKRPDLKVDMTLPEAESWEELLQELLPLHRLLTYGSIPSILLTWPGHLAKALKEAGCSTIKWEDLTAEDMHLLFAQDRALELQFPHHKDNPANLDPATLFTASFVTRVTEKAQVAEKKTANQAAAAAARQKKGVTANISHIKGDAQSVLEAYEDELF